MRFGGAEPSKAREQGEACCDLIVGHKGSCYKEPIEWSGPAYQVLQVKRAKELGWHDEENDHVSDESDGIFLVQRSDEPHTALFQDTPYPDVSCRALNDAFDAGHERGLRDALSPATQLQLWLDMVKTKNETGISGAREWAEAAAKDGRATSVEAVYAVLDVWAELGIWDYGVSPRCGWVELHAISPDALATPEEAAAFVAANPNWIKEDL